MPPARSRPRHPPWRRRLAPPLLLLTLLAACTAPPPPEPPLPYPPAARERVLRIALAEWEEWGRITLDAGDALPPPEAAPAPAGEAAPENFPRVLAYWRAVPEEAWVIARNRGLYRAELLAAGGGDGDANRLPPRLWREPPWSAAFVSYVMRSAGLDGREFPPSAAHSTYIDALIADALAFPATAPFLPRAPEDHAPRPGDLVCADRSAPPLRHWRERVAESGRFRPMHCDIVVRTAPGVVEAVGGNVRDAVTLTRFPADPATGGRLLPRPGPGLAVWFAVFENRLGRLPPWAPPAEPAIALRRAAP